MSRRRRGPSGSLPPRAVRGFTLIEVLVALVIVVFGMAALLEALSSAAENVSQLRERTLAEWVALNQVAAVRLSLQLPQLGTTEGEVRNFGHGDWQWRQTVQPVPGIQIPGLYEITVRVRRAPPAPAGALAAAQARVATGGQEAHRNASASGWLVRVMGFRGRDVATSSGLLPDWTGGRFAARNGPGGPGGNGSFSLGAPSTGGVAGSPRGRP